MRTKIVEKRVADLLPADYNPRWISKKAFRGLSESIKEFGVVQPIVLNERTGQVVGGHQRLKVLKDQGVDMVNVVVVDLDQTDEIALNIALNSEKIRGDWGDNIGDIIAEIEEYDQELFASTLVGDLKAKLGVYEQSLAQQEDNVLPIDAPSTVKDGDVWMLGKHKLICGVAIPPVLDRLLEGSTVDCVVTDLVGRCNLVTLVGNIPMSPVNSVYVAVSSRECVDARVLLEQSGVTFSSYLIYQFETPRASGSLLASSYDVVIYGWAGKHKFYGSASSDSVTKESDLKTRGDGFNKPVEFYCQLIINSTLRGNIVLDPCCGTGSTLIACERSHRIGFLVGEPGECDMTIARFKQVFGDNEIRKMT